ncbi:MAG: cyclic nucleotide-binding domain-containing protein [Deltaproteobacteria bacterium]|nr:cyclic nucleotide-binding domain-containing protein [Deltaproteobacteria bacterium]
MKDVRVLREEAAEATAQGKHKRALAAYLELERMEPRDAQWAKRAGETYRKLGNNKNAIEAFERSVERYAQNGFLVQAIAVCKLVLQIDPEHADTLRRLAQMNQQIGQGPTRAAGMAEHNLALHDSPNVAAIRRNSGTVQELAEQRSQRLGTIDPSRTQPLRTDAQRSQQLRSDVLPIRRNKPSTPPVFVHPSQSPVPTQPLALSRTKSRPISLPPHAALETVQLAKEVPEAHLRDASMPGIHVIPIDAVDDVGDDVITRPIAIGVERGSMPIIEIDVADDSYEAEVEEPHELDLEDLEEIPLPAPRAIGAAAARALAATPLFAGMPSETLEALVANLTLLTIEAGETLFHEGDPGDALYVVVDGELSVQNEGPPRVEMQRLGPGSFIGEVALLTEQPRSATVTALSFSELLRIDRPTLSHVLGTHGDMLGAILRFIRDRLVDRWMRTSPLFRPMDEGQRADLAAKFTFLEIEAGTTLIGAGQRPDGLYIVLAGVFVVARSSRTVAQLGAGDLIGETALLSGGAFRSDVVAMGKSLALCLPASVFREVIMTHPHVLEYVGEQAEHSRRLQIL